MNHYTELLYYIKSLAEAHPFPKTVTQGEIDDIDLSKGNIYPLFHIVIGDAQFSNGQTVILSVQMGCFQQRDKRKEIVNDKFWGNDNGVDNFNETLATLNFVWLNMYRNFQNKDITAVENPVLEKMEDGLKNGLDGWILSVDIEMPNTDISLCQ